MGLCPGLLFAFELWVLGLTPVARSDPGPGGEETSRSIILHFHTACFHLSPQFFICILLGHDDGLRLIYWTMKEPLTMLLSRAQELSCIGRTSSGKDRYPIKSHQPEKIWFPEVIDEKGGMREENHYQESFPSKRPLVANGCIF